MKKEIVDEVLKAYKWEREALPKRTINELLKNYLVEAGLKVKQANEIIRDMHEKERKDKKKNLAEEKKRALKPEHGTSCPRLVVKKTEDMIKEW